MSTPEDASPPPPPPPTQVLDDADDLRGHHFKLLMGRPLTWFLIGGFALIGAAAGAIFLSAPIGGAVAAAVIVAGILIVFAIADNRAAEAFFTAYAKERGLELGGRSPLPPATPLLRKGDDRYAERTLSGPIGAGLEGILALYTYEEESTDSKGNRQTNYYRYTVGLVNVPECVDHIPELYCQRKFGFRALEKFEDVFRGSKARVSLESEVLQEKYEIFAKDKQDPIWLRRLFSPTFIVWLTDSAPEKFAFELVGGNLCCYVSGHKEKAADLDTIAAASATVAKRLREEASE
ncbi:MAG: hypothetical protein JJE35_15730 [Thermoleophilia bacterium]|nr:hypothetical protein [Thermoleophilia bacterium]